VPDSSRYAPPEVAKGGWGTITAQSIPALDSWYFAILMFELFSGPFSNSEQLSSPKGFPSGILPPYKRLISPGPKTRLPVAQFLDQGKRNGGYFDTPLIRITEFIENMSVKSEFERKEFLRYNIMFTKQRDTLLTTPFLASWTTSTTSSPKATSP
jgi:SCY1-like protein 1